MHGHSARNALQSAFLNESMSAQCLDAGAKRGSRGHHTSGSPMHRTKEHIVVVPVLQPQEGPVLHASVELVHLTPRGQVPQRTAEPCVSTNVEQVVGVLMPEYLDESFAAVRAGFKGASCIGGPLSEMWSGPRCPRALSGGAWKRCCDEGTNGSRWTEHAVRPSPRIHNNSTPSRAACKLQLRSTSGCVTPESSACNTLLMTSKDCLFWRGPTWRSAQSFCKTTRCERGPLSKKRLICLQ